MTVYKSLILFGWFSLIHVKAIWPPSYKVNLSHEESFVISEIISSDDSDDAYQAEDEMIKLEELKSFDITKDVAKLSALHQMTSRKNNEYKKKRLSYKKKPKEYDYETEDTDWESKFKSKDIKYSNTKLLNTRDTNLNSKRYNDTNVTQEKNMEEQNYDYNSLKEEYYSNIKKTEILNDTLNYTEIKDEESLKDALASVIGNKNVRNCTIEERQGIGLAAAECLWTDLIKPDITYKERSRVFHRIGTIIVIWVLIYVLVAIPCWCQRGWCCCCFQCKFCRPQEKIDIAKKYLLDNPLGVYHASHNEKIIYKPSNYEKYAHKNLEKALLKL